MKKQLSTVLLVALVIFTQFSCKKGNLEPSGTDEQGTIEKQEALLKDSTYYYSWVYSLWSESLPTPRFLSTAERDLRSFTKNYSDAEQVLGALVERYMPLDRFSFIDRQRQVSEEIEQGQYRDIGIAPQFVRDGPSSNDVVLLIRLVQKNSPAEGAELKRGQRVLAVDGKPISFTVNNRGQVQGDIGAFNKIMTGDVSSLGVYDFEEGRELTVQIPSADRYPVDPFVVQKVLEHHGKRVGYIAYDSFVSVRHSGTSIPNAQHTKMVGVFSDLEGEIDELIVDLRYNGGGAVNAAELMTNLIVPGAEDGNIMYRYAFNQQLENAGWTDENNPRAPYGPERINKTGLPDLGLTKVYFLVTDRTASSSELVINSLKPYMNVQIISSGDGTYGKPVGSFRIGVMDRYADLYITSFQTVNANGEGEYFDGLAAQQKKVQDGLSRQLGDPQENMLAEALHHIEHGSYRATSQSGQAKARTGKQNQVFLGESLNVPTLERSIQGAFIFDQLDMD